MRTFVLNTGGTLGMVGKPLHPAKSAKELFRGIRVPAGIRLTLEDFPKRRDSTDIPHRLRIQMSEIIERVYDGQDSFTILHGTDTLEETTAALCMIFKNSLQKSVFVIGSQMTKDEPGSDVTMQLENTLRVAKSFYNNHVVGVYTVTMGDVWHGARVRKKNESDFNSFYTPGIYQVARAWPHIMLSRDVRRQDPALAVQGLKLEKRFEPWVASGISVTADTPPWLVMHHLLSKPLLFKGFLFMCKGSGQINDLVWYDPKLKRRYSWINVIQEATERGVHIGIFSPFDDGEVNLDRYELGLKAKRAGAISMGTMVPLMADFKFRQAIAMFGKNRQKIEEFCLTDIVGEQLPRTADVMDVVPD